MTNKSLKKSLLVLLLAPGLIFPLAKISNTNNVSNNTNQAGVTAVPQQQVNKMVIMFKGKQVNDVIKLLIDKGGNIFLNTYNEGLLVSADKGKTFMQITDASSAKVLNPTDFVKKFSMDTANNIVLVVGDNKVLTFGYTVVQEVFSIPIAKRITQVIYSGQLKPTFINDIRFGVNGRTAPGASNFFTIMSDVGIFGVTNPRANFQIIPASSGKSITSYSIASVKKPDGTFTVLQALITAGGEILYDWGTSIGSFINVASSFTKLGMTAFSDVTVTQFGELLVAGGSINNTNALVETKVVIGGTEAAPTATVNIIKTTRMNESINLVISSLLTEEGKASKQIVYVATDTGVYQTATFINSTQDSLPPFKKIVSNFPTSWIAQSLQDSSKLIITSQTQGVLQTTVTDQVPTPANKAAGVNIANIDIAILSLVVIMLAVIGSTIFYKVGKEKGLFNKKVVKVSPNKPTKK